MDGAVVARPFTVEMSVSDEDVVARLRKVVSPAIELIDGQVISFDPASREITMHYTATPAMCHSQVIVQGGFITAMVDSTMAYCAMGCNLDRIAVPTLEIKVSFLHAGNAGPMVAKARPLRLGKSVGFLEAELFQHDQLIATSSSTVRIIPLQAKTE
jgi:acyl-CoA thioesterase